MTTLAVILSPAKDLRILPGTAETCRSLHYADEKAVYFGRENRIQEVRRGRLTGGVRLQLVIPSLRYG